MKHPTFFVKLLCLILLLALLGGYQREALARAEMVAAREQEISEVEAHNREILKLMSQMADRYSPGTYEGEAQGFGGIVRVRVTVSAEEITAITVVSSSGEDAAYFQQADALIPKIIGSQTTALDAVTGATLSSIGLLDAVDQALEQAVK